MDLKEDQTEKQEQEKTIKIKKLIKEEQICNLAEIVIDGHEVDILEKMKIARGKNEKVIRVVKKMQKGGVKLLREDEWQIKGDFVLKEKKVYVLKNKKLRIEIIQLYYNIPVARYRGRQKTIQLIMRNYQQPEITKYIEKYVDGYNIITILDLAQIATQAKT